MAVIHLTLTGYYAGRPLCDCDKVQEKDKGAEFYHAAYFRDWNNPAVCPECRAIWEDEDDEVDD